MNVSEKRKAEKCQESCKKSIVLDKYIPKIENSIGNHTEITYEEGDKTNFVEESISMNELVDLRLDMSKIVDIALLREDEILPGYEIRYVTELAAYSDVVIYVGGLDWCWKIDAQKFLYFFQVFFHCFSYSLFF